MNKNRLEKHLRQGRAYESIVNFSEGLIACTRRGDIAAARIMLACGAWGDHDDGEPLIVAAECKQYEIVGMILDSGARLEMRDGLVLKMAQADEALAATIKARCTAAKRPPASTAPQP